MVQIKVVQLGKRLLTINYRDLWAITSGFIHMELESQEREHKNTLRSNDQNFSKLDKN